LKIAALFTDYDGTLAPAGVRREDSSVPAPLASVLARISSLIPVAVITSKDMEFVRPRTPFAWAWATVMGLEVRLSDGSGTQVRVSEELSKVLRRVMKGLPSEVIVEVKRGTDGTILGASLDWTLTRGPPPAEVKAAEATFRSEGFQVDAPEGAKYIDVFAAPADKGSAVRALVDFLGAKGPVMYLGDTQADNEAFRACEVPVCVHHSQSVDNLDCDFFVLYQELPDMLEVLLRNGLQFDYPLNRANWEARNE
jgi:trehalose-phosphatase